MPCQAKFVFGASLLVLLACLITPVLAQTDSTEELRREAFRQTASIQQGGRHWLIFETEFFTIHHQSTNAPDPVACQELDSFVTRTLNSLDPNGLAIQTLRENKLAYYLCNDATVEILTGYQTKGMADLAGRAVISSHFPHFHELAHLLVHLLMEEKPSQTHPLVQEGLACLIGGRWGRAPQTVLYTGWVHRNFGMGELADALTRDGFYSLPGGADVAYPMGAVLCEIVRRQAGWNGVMELNKKLSGTVEFVSSLSAVDVEEYVAEICGWDDETAGVELKNRMANIWPEFRRCGIYPAESIPTVEPTWEYSDSLSQVKLWNGQTSQVVWVKSDQFPVFLLSPNQNSSRAFSSLFKDHLPLKQYLGQRYGLRCDPENIALYDYATNQLVATWVASFTDEMDGCGTSQTGLLFEIGSQGGSALEPSEIRWNSIAIP